MLKTIRALATVGIASSMLVVTGAALADGPQRGGSDRYHRSVPEISGTHVGAGLALVLGGAAVVLGRRRRKVG